MPIITANSTKEDVMQARRIALESKKSLRQWAGDALHRAIEAYRQRNRLDLKSGAKMPRPKLKH